MLFFFLICFGKQDGFWQVPVVWSWQHWGAINDQKLWHSFSFQNRLICPSISSFLAIFFRIFFEASSFFVRPVLAESILLSEAFVLVVTLLEESFFMVSFIESSTFWGWALRAGFSLAVLSTFLIGTLSSFFVPFFSAFCNSEFCFSH